MCLSGGTRDPVALLVAVESSLPPRHPRELRGHVGHDMQSLILFTSAVIHHTVLLGWATCIP